MSSIHPSNFHLSNHPSNSALSVPYPFTLSSTYQASAPSLIGTREGDFTLAKTFDDFSRWRGAAVWQSQVAHLTVARKQRKMVTTLSFYSDQGLRLWDGTSHIQCGPPPSVNTLWKPPHRHTRRCATPVSQVVPTPGRGMREINTHTAHPFLHLPSARPGRGWLVPQNCRVSQKQVAFCSIIRSSQFLILT